MMRPIFYFIVLLLLILTPCISTAQKNAVLVIVDGMGASYLYPELSPQCVDGSPLEQVKLDLIDKASARYTLKVPVPKTEYGHAVIMTGYSGADDEMLTYYDATIFDSLRKEGYMCIGVMQTGDSSNMVREMDAIVSDKNNSPVSPDFQYLLNDPKVPGGVQAILQDNPHVSDSSAKPQIADYLRYDNWPLDKAVQLVTYLNSTYPGQKYLLTVNVAGTDESSHESGYKSYSATMAGLDPGISELAKACRESGTIMVVTADHGMSFKTQSAKGSHASEGVDDRNESRLIPLLIFTDQNCLETGDLYGQECVAPTLLSLMECPQGLSLGDGEPLPWNDRPALQLVAARPTNATISGPGFTKRVLVDGVIRMDGLERGDYRIESDDRVQVINLTHDTVVRLSTASPGQSGMPVLLLFLAAIALAATGIAVALYRQQ